MMMTLNPNLYVEIVPFAGPRSPAPHPINDARFDPSLIYKVLGCYSPSETSESYFVLSNQRREIWFISNRHVRAHSLHESAELTLPRESAREQVREPAIEQQPMYSMAGAGAGGSNGSNRLQLHSPE